MVLVTVVLAWLLLGTAVQSLFALQNEIETAESALGTPHASKTVAQPQAVAGGTLDYTIVVSNSGATPINSVVITDALPGAVTYVVDSFDDSEQVFAFGTGSVVDNVLVWSGSIGQNGYVRILLSATITDVVMVGDMITNTAVVDADGDALSATAVTEIVDSVVDLSGSEKMVDLDVAEPGSELLYTVYISNSGMSDAASVAMTDMLPAELLYVTDSLTATSGSFAEASGVITWTGAVAAGNSVSVQFAALVVDTVDPGTVLTNTAEISGTGMSYSLSATTLITMAEPTTTTLFLPVIKNAPPTLVVQASRPNSSNEWRVFWESAGSNFTYELQEAKSADFTNATTFLMGSDVSRDITNHGPSLANIYYYRARVRTTTDFGPWSNTVIVRGAWQDDFDNTSSGWSMRRTTYLEQTNAYYGSGSEAGYYIIVVADRWDWVLASPLVAAPTVPYAIEYRARVHDASNLVSGGMVVGGDWNGGACPDWSNVYQTTNCFNHFYNFNYIFYGPLKLLFEDVDALAWCPNCGGSPLKRLGDYQDGDAFDVFGNGPAENWHTYRIEARQNELRLYIDGSYKRSFTDAEAWWLTGPYFGVFASTDEYKPSIWFYDYFKFWYLD
ncbi:MAG: DUF11 domain-containing protein [Anaerolineales bacterium]|nr:DUF11 domain-containing protein [Anaerolineales bacterium]